MALSNNALLLSLISRDGYAIATEADIVPVGPAATVYGAIPTRKEPAVVPSTEPLLVRLPVSTIEWLAADIRMELDTFEPGSMPLWAFTQGEPSAGAGDWHGGGWHPDGYVNRTIRALSPTFGNAATAQVPLTVGGYNVFLTFGAVGTNPIRLTHRLILY